MSQASTANVLNRLLGACYRSLPMYLADVRPYYAIKKDEQLEATLTQIVADQQRLVDLISELLIDYRAGISTGEFPMDFTSCHDCSLEYLGSELIRFQKQDIETIEQCVDDLSPNTAARSLAEEALGSAKGHLLSLEEAMQQALSSAV